MLTHHSFAIFARYAPYIGEALHMWPDPLFVVPNCAMETFTHSCRNAIVGKRRYKHQHETIVEELWKQYQHDLCVGVHHTHTKAVIGMRSKVLPLTKQARSVGAVQALAELMEKGQRPLIRLSQQISLANLDDLAQLLSIRAFNPPPIFEVDLHPQLAASLPSKYDILVEPVKDKPGFYHIL